MVVESQEVSFIWLDPRGLGLELGSGLATVGGNGQGQLVCFFKDGVHEVNEQGRLECFFKAGVRQNPWALTQPCMRTQRTRRKNKNLKYATQKRGYCS